MHTKCTKEIHSHTKEMKSFHFPGREFNSLPKLRDVHKTMHFHHVSYVHSFTLNLRLGSSANPFHHRPFPYLPDCQSYWLSFGRIIFKLNCLFLQATVWNNIPINRFVETPWKTTLTLMSTPTTLLPFISYRVRATAWSLGAGPQTYRMYYGRGLSVFSRRHNH